MSRTRIGVAWLGLVAAAVSAWGDVHYVKTDGGNVPPYASWATAAREIQAAVDAASAGDAVEVAGGTYRPAAEIAVSKGIVVRGAAEGRPTVVDGGGKHRVFSVESDQPAALERLAIVNGAADGAGGGVRVGWLGTVRNCIVTGCKADEGGGIYAESGGLVVSSAVHGNRAVRGGGIYLGAGGRAENCRAVLNVARETGGGLYDAGGVALDSTFAVNAAGAPEGVDVAAAGGAKTGADRARCATTAEYLAGLATSAGPLDQAAPSSSALLNPSTIDPISVGDGGVRIGDRRGDYVFLGDGLWVYDPDPLSVHCSITVEAERERSLFQRMLDMANDFAWNMLAKLRFHLGGLFGYGGGSIHGGMSGFDVANGGSGSLWPSGPIRDQYDWNLRKWDWYDPGPDPEPHYFDPRETVGHAALREKLAGPDGQNPENNAQAAGEPVSVHNGCFTKTETDLVVPGRGLEVRIARTYNSQKAHDGRWGHGWFLNYDARLERAPDGNVAYHDEAGQWHVYRRQADGSYRTPQGRYDALTVTDAGAELRAKDGTVRRFDGETGCLEEIADPNGNRIRLTWSTELSPVLARRTSLGWSVYGPVAADYRLEKIADALGREIAFSYDALGRIESIEDFAGRRVDYAVDDAGDLVAVTYPAYRPAVGEKERRDTVGFAYSQGFDDPALNHNLLRALDADGRTYLENRYDEEDRVVWQDYGGGEWRFAYALDLEDLPDGTLVQVHYPREGAAPPAVPAGTTLINGLEALGETRVVDPAGNETVYVWNWLGNVVEERAGTKQRDGRFVWAVTRSQFTAGSELVRRENPEGGAIELAYDARGNVTVARQTPGPRGGDQAEQVWRLAYDPVFNRVRTITDPAGATTTCNYDSRGNLTEVVAPAVGGASPKWTIENDACGRPVSVRSPAGNATALDYDPATGRLTALTRGAGVLDYATRIEYDAAGLFPVAMTDARGNRSSYEYNAQGYLLRMLSPLGNEIRRAYDRNGNNVWSAQATGDAAQPWRITTAQYDVLGRVLAATDPLGQTARYQYDGLGNATNAIDAEGRTNRFVYEGRGRLVKTIDPGGTATERSYDRNGNLVRVLDGLGRAIVWRRDGYDRPVETRYPDGTRATARYDALGRVVQATGRAGETVARRYDVLGRLIRTIRPERTLDYAYDAASRLLAIDDSQLGRTRYAYNEADWMVSEIRPDGKALKYEYWPDGARKSLRYPSGLIVACEWDEDGALAELRDVGGRSIASYWYDPLGRRAGMELGNGATADYAYDLGDRLGLVEHAGSAGDLLVRFEYGRHDGAGRLLEMKRIDPQGTRRAGFEYDPAGQLVQADYAPALPFATGKVAYDRAGNRTSAAVGGIATTYKPNAVNQYLQVGAESLAYDPRGNLARFGSQRYQYDSRNQLVRAETPSGTYAYAYDALGRRVRKQGPGVDVRYVYDGAHVIEEYDGADRLVARYVHGPGADEPVRMERGGREYYYHGDRQGSVAALTDDSGAQVETYVYDAWGRAASHGIAGNPFFFTGREYDRETGLCYYRARHYSAELGRFLQNDPVGYAGGLNLYAYCANDPVNFTDPSGCYAEFMVPLPWAPEQAFWRQAFATVIPEMREFYKNCAIAEGEKSLGGLSASGDPNVRFGMLVFSSLDGGGTKMDPAHVVHFEVQGIKLIKGKKITVYRGLSVGHPKYEKALKGIAEPLGGHTDPAKHNGGNCVSEFTSWSLDLSTAYRFAKEHGEGVILMQDVLVDDLIQSPDICFEYEVLRMGTIEGATVIDLVY